MPFTEKKYDFCCKNISVQLAIIRTIIKKVICPYPQLPVRFAFTHAKTL